MADQLVELKWTRPDTTTSKYPRVWRTFKTRDLDSDTLVEYRIQDLPDSRLDEALAFMLTSYVNDEPVSQVLGGSNDDDHKADLTMMWKAAHAQKVSFVCIKIDSDEIIGINMNLVNSKGEQFIETIQKLSKSQITKDLIDIIALLYKDFDVFEHYGVNEYFSSVGLAVHAGYRGRGIAKQLLESSFDEIFKLHPKYPFSNISSRGICAKTLVIQDL